MCRISKETVIRANEKTISRGRVIQCASSVTRGEITVSTKYRGEVYSQKVTIKGLKESYARSYKAVVENGKAI